MIGLMMLAAASPYFMTGNELYQHCTTGDGDQVCAGYVEGIVDAAGLYQDTFHHQVICVPSAANVRQTTDVVTKYLREHPESRAQGAGALTILALAGAFRCEAKGS